MGFALASSASIGRLRINRMHMVGLGSQSTIFFQFYLLDRPPHKTAQKEPSLDEALEQLKLVINQGDVQIDMARFIGVTSKFSGTNEIKDTILKSRQNIFRKPLVIAL